MSGFWYSFVVGLLDLTLLFLFSRFVLGCKPRKVLLAIIVFLHGVCLCLYYMGFNDLIALIVATYYLSMILMYFAFPQAKFRFQAAFYFLLGTFSTATTLLFSTFGLLNGPSGGLTTPIAIPITIILGTLFVSKLRHRIREIVVATPRWALIYASIVFCVLQGMNSILFLNYFYVDDNGTD